MKIKKKTIALIVIVLAMVIFFMAMYIRNSAGKVRGLVKADEQHTYSYFLNSGEDSMYYSSYAENPAIQYWCSQEFETSDGGTSNVAFDFLVAPKGEESDTLNNLLGNKKTWPDVVHLTYSSVAIKDAYEAGFIIDLGPYLDKCMPNYVAMLNKYGIREDSKAYADGEWRDLGLTSFSTRDITSPWSGYQYRRDWIIKYGTPVPGSQAEKDGGFDGYYTLKNDGTPCHVSMNDYNTTINGDSWTDNVTFPSWERRNDADGENGGMKWYADWCEENGKVWDGKNPVTISDWEWMFGFFKTAISEQGISDGYVHSIYYPGYIENGDFVTGFGGIGAHFYLDDDDNFCFGGLEEGFEAYLQCMNAWYKNGWIDNQFNTKSTSAFYEIDSDLVRQGKIGCWFGTISTIGSRIYKDNLPLTVGAVVGTAAQPINDIYDAKGNAIKAGRKLTDKVALSVPNCFFTDSEYAANAVVFSKNILDDGKDLEALLRAIDYLYSEEGSRVMSLGLTAEQLAESSNYVRNMYEKYGLSEGAYTVTDDGNGNKTYARVPQLNSDVDLWSVVAAQKVIGYNNKTNMEYGYTDFYNNLLEQYIIYDNHAFPSSRLMRYTVTDAEGKYMSQTYSRITTTFLYQQVPRFIKGTKSIEKDWQEIKDGLVTRGVQRCCDINNKYIQEIKNESK